LQSFVTSIEIYSDEQSCGHYDWNLKWLWL